MTKFSPARSVQIHVIYLPPTNKPCHPPQNPAAVLNPSMSRPTMWHMVNKSYAFAATHHHFHCDPLVHHQIFEFRLRLSTPKTKHSNQSNDKIWLPPGPATTKGSPGRPNAAVNEPHATWTPVEELKACIPSGLNSAPAVPPPAPGQPIQWKQFNVQPAK